MWIVRSRSSRLFVVLLHLVGVSRRLPAHVRPCDILLQRLDPNANDEAQQQQHAFWLQDTETGRCLTPLATLSDCGDATLWRLLPRQKTDKRHKRRQQWISWALEEEDEEDMLLDDQDDRRFHLHHDHGGECLQRDLRTADCRLDHDDSDRLTLPPWRIDEDGILNYYMPTRKERRKKRRKKRRTSNLLPTVRKGQCVVYDMRNGTSTTTTDIDIVSCSAVENDADESDSDSQNKHGALIRFALVRQVTVGEDDGKEKNSSPLDNAEVKEDEISTLDPPAAEAVSIPTHRNGLGSSAASSAKSDTPELKRPSLFRFRSGSASSDSNNNNNRLPLQFLTSAHPTLLFPEVQDDPEADDLDSDKPHRDSSVPQKKHKVPRTSSFATSDDVGIRKVQMIHPYIASAKDEKWTDPLTGLTYPTDLHQYLGHDRRDSGRHTLTGVGLYMRTMLKIKIYGIALYVSKRDVLADPSMEAFAGLSATELRNSPDFFKTLRHMHAPGFDRTLLIKTNMQLSTETMRSSLEADWKKLTSDAKTLLVGSSLKARDVTDNMRAIVEDEVNNQSRCSCAQMAPDVDPTCCARGTELAFTWRKNGDLEVRLNGDFMDSFPRPDIASGIFYEYLRLDDPMSFDFLDHVVDGFPFLLSPLSQVKGVTAGMPQPASSKPPAAMSSGFNPIMKAFSTVNDVVSTQAMNLAGSIQSGASGAAHYVGGAARTLTEHVDKRRVQVSQAVSSLYQQSRNDRSVSIPYRHHMFVGSNGGEYHDLLEKEPTIKDLVLRWIWGAGPSNTPIMPDEIIPMTVPPAHWSQRLFFGMVHLYLLLLLIVSVPTDFRDIGATNQKLKLQQQSQKSSSSSSTSSIPDSASDSDDSCESSYHFTPRRRDPPDDDDDSDHPPAQLNFSSSNHHRFRIVPARASSDDIRSSLAAGKDHAKIKKSLSYVL